MVSVSSPKRRVVISYENLSEQLREALKERYPLGYTDFMIRVDKPNGEFFYGVVLETEQTSYLVKVKVKIDQAPTEDIDKDLYDTNDQDDEIKGAEDIADSTEEPEEE